jgi:5-methylcytosine-specific restriction endonuclease McrA
VTDHFFKENELTPQIKLKGIKFLSRKRVSQTILLKYLRAGCENCSAKENLTVDHKVPLASGGKNDETNIRILCRKCQNKYHGTVKPKKSYR